VKESNENTVIGTEVSQKQILPESIPDSATENPLCEPSSNDSSSSQGLPTAAETEQTEADYDSSEHNMQVKEGTPPVTDMEGLERFGVKVRNAKFLDLNTEWENNDENGFDLVFTEPPQNMGNDEMIEFAEHVNLVLKPGGFVLLVVSVTEFSAWSTALLSGKRNMKVMDYPFTICYTPSLVPKSKGKMFPQKATDLILVAHSAEKSSKDEFIPSFSVEYQTHLTHNLR